MTVKEDFLSFYGFKLNLFGGVIMFVKAKRLVGSILVVCLLTWTMVGSIAFEVEANERDEEEFEPVVIVEHGFEDGYDGWVTRGGQGTLTRTTEAAHSGEYSLKITERTQDWHMPRIEITNYLEKGATYHIELYVRFAEGVKPSHMYLAVLDRAGTIDTELRLCEDTLVTDSEWVKLEGEYVFSSYTTGAYVYVYAKEDPTASYLIDDFKITMIKPPVEEPPQWTVVASYDFEDGELNGWRSRGGTTVEITDEEAYTGQKSLKVTGRTQNWHGAELDVKGILNKGVTYEISAYVKLIDQPDSDRAIKITMQNKATGEERNWTTVAQKVVSSNEWVELRGLYTFNKDMDELILYIESSGATDSYYIDSIEIRTQVEVSPPQTPSSYVYDFEDGTSQGWGPRGAAKVEVTDEASYEGNYSLKVTERTANWHGTQLDVKGILVKGIQYEISAYVKLINQPAGKTQIVLTMEQAVKGGSSEYKWISNREVSNNTEWVELRGNYSFSADMDKLILYIEAQNPQDSYYVDKVEIRAISSPQPPPIQTDIPALKEVFSKYFTIGAAVEPSHLEGRHAEILKMHYNFIVAENVMKPENIQPYEGVFNWTNADKIFDFAEKHGMGVRFHTLVWHQQTPKWFFLDENGNDMTKETDPEKREANKQLLLKRLENHITAIVQRYKDKVDAWDVVNEAIDPSAPDGYRRSPWYEITGTEYIETAFRVVRKLDPDAKLYYNDYNTHDPKKRDLIYQMVLDLREKGIKIDGIGHQTHINIDQPHVALIAESIEKFASLGLDNAITELDVSIYTDSAQSYASYEDIPESILIRQAYRYKTLFDEFKRLSEHISNVTFWGIGDDHTWLDNRPIPRKDAPFVFDINLQAKPAYWAIVDPSKLPALNQEISIPYGTPVIDGEQDPVWYTLSWKPFESADNFTVQFKALWDEQHLYVLVDVSDKTLQESDVVEVFWSRGESVEKATLQRRGTNSEGANFAVIEKEEGYMMEIAIPLDSRVNLKDQIYFDIRVKDDNNIFSWNDFSNQQDNDVSRLGVLTLVEQVKIGKAIYGTATVDAQLDPQWEKAQMYTTDTWIQGSEGAKATFRTMWDEKYLYVFAEVEDASLSDLSANAWEQDSIEIFVDQNNNKTSYYEADDGQFRVNFNNVQTFGGNASAEHFITATRVVEGGYIVEAAIELDAVSSSEGSIIGFDLQVNDDANGDGVRDNVVTWNDRSGKAYMDASKFGIMQLVLTQDEPGDEPGDEPDEPGDELGDEPGDGPDEPGDGLGDEPDEPGDEPGNESGDELDEPGDEPGDELGDEPGEKEKIVQTGWWLDTFAVLIIGLMLLVIGAGLLLWAKRKENL